MFERALIEGTRRHEIIVQTRRGSNIRNYVAPPPTQQDINFYYGVIRKTHGKAWKLRKHATGFYNCAGMVFASRRTALTEPVDWELILVEDEYRLLQHDEEPALGDVVVYRNSEDNEILHLARICQVDRLTDQGQPISKLIPKALSKWDQRCGEDVHALEDVFLVGGAATRIELWTDRPAAADERVQAIPEILMP